MKTAKQNKKTDKQLSPEMVIKIRPKRWGTTTVGKIYGKSKCWVWSGTEMEWCTVKVMIMMNWWEKDEMTVTGTHHQEVGKVL